MSFFWAVESSSPNIWEKASLTFILVNALLPRFYGHFMILHAIQLYGNVTKLGGIDAAALELSLQSHHFSCIHIHTQLDTHKTKNVGKRYKKSFHSLFGFFFCAFEQEPGGTKKNCQHKLFH